LLTVNLRPNDMKSLPSKTAAKKRRVLVADDHPLFLEGLVQLINRERDLHCCGGADSVAATQMAVTLLKPDLLVLDLRLKDGDGLELIKTLKGRFPSLRMLVLSQNDEALYAERALRAGARGYVMKEEATNEVLNAMRTILRGELYVSRKMSVLALHKLLSTASGVRGNYVERLTDRELQVFQMIGAGKGTADIASELRLSFKTVETHRENIKHKLGLRNAVDLVCHAVHWIHGSNAADPRSPARPASD
jgi:DNA-binding NarL/FixJ family response regulator